jgi:hypothetical protein
MVLTGMEVIGFIATLPRYLDKQLSHATALFWKTGPILLPAFCSALPDPSFDVSSLFIRFCA